MTVTHNGLEARIHTAFLSRSVEDVAWMGHPWAGRSPMQDPPAGANGSVAAVPSATGAFGGVAERFQVGKEWRAESGSHEIP